ncbi:MAG: tripartite tricarboxylate transporter substrate binding protein [Geminicoccaceae bacterium]
MVVATQRARRAFFAGSGALAVLIGLATFGLSGPARAAYPEKPIKIIVPTQAGGGMDSVARILQRFFESHPDVLGSDAVIVNMPGAGGTIGTRAIKDADPDGYTVGFWHEGLITSSAMGVADFDHESFEILGATGYGDLGFGVSVNSPYQTFDELIAAAKAHPDSVKCATNVGLPVHFVPLMVASKAGVQFRYVQVGGGAKRFPSVVAMHTDFAIFGSLEFVKWADADLKPIVMFSEERLDILPDVPTAREKGIDVVAKANRIWLAPKGTSKEVQDHVVNALRTAMADPEVQNQLNELGVVPKFVEAAELRAELDWWKAQTEPLVAKARELQN